MAQKVGILSTAQLMLSHSFFFLNLGVILKEIMKEGGKSLFLRPLAFLGKRPFLVQCQMDELTPETHSVVNNADTVNRVNVVYSH